LTTFGGPKYTNILQIRSGVALHTNIFSCPVWNPYLVKHNIAIKAIQGRASKLICGPDKEYHVRRLELKWDSLELKRKYLSLVEMYKIINGYCSHHYFDIIGITSNKKVSMSIK